MSNFIDKWDNFALHTWLICSSFGIIFAILSFFEDLGCLDKMKENVPASKGLIAFFVGFIFYIFIGLRHLEGGRKRFERKPYSSAI